MHNVIREREYLIENVVTIYLYCTARQLLVDKTNFGSVLYNHANFYRFEETSCYWSVTRLSVFLCFSLVNQRHDTPPPSRCMTAQCPISKTLNGPSIAAIAVFFFFHFFHISTCTCILLSSFIVFLSCL